MIGDVTYYVRFGSEKRDRTIASKLPDVVRVVRAALEASYPWFTVGCYKEVGVTSQSSNAKPVYEMLWTFSWFRRPGPTGRRLVGTLYHIDAGELGFDVVRAIIEERVRTDGGAT